MAKSFYIMNHYYHIFKLTPLGYPNQDKDNFNPLYMDFY